MNEEKNKFICYVSTEHEIQWCEVAKQIEANEGMDLVIEHISAYECVQVKK